MRNPTIGLVMAFIATSGAAQELQPKELGAVAFARDLDATLRTKPTKPVFLLFQEIPG